MTGTKCDFTGCSNPAELDRLFTHSEEVFQFCPAHDPLDDPIEKGRWMEIEHA